MANRAPWWGASVKRLRIERNMTTKTLAHKSNMDQSSISNIENGIRDNPTITTIEKLLAPLGYHLVIEEKKDTNDQEERL